MMDGHSDITGDELLVLEVWHRSIVAVEQGEIGEEDVDPNQQAEVGRRGLFAVHVC